MPTAASPADARSTDPLDLPVTAGDTRGRTVVLTKQSVMLALLGLAVFAYLQQDRGMWHFGLATACVIVPLGLVASRIWRARRGQVEFGLLRHPLRREFRPHLVQGLNVWLLCVLLGGVVAAGGLQSSRILFSLNAAQMVGVMAIFAAGLIVLAALALVPLRRVYAASNVLVALLSGFLIFQLVPLAHSPADPVVLDSPLVGEWFVFNSGRSGLINGHGPNEGDAIDFMRLGVNGRTHTGGAGAPLADYAGFGLPVLAPADGRIAGVTDDQVDTPPGTNGDHANSLVIDIGGGRYVALAHLKHGSLRVGMGDVVRRGQPLAEVGNSGHTNEPHLHLQVQDSAAGSNAERTLPMVFRKVQITRGNVWPWRDDGELRSGDLVRTLGE
ncbi:MAG TPA: M23 family metallopeptidase [Propionibacteriaceae bacterium]|nr:M23 family metallopeptidase [Propionibacteriaceae bacterium]